MSNKKDIQSLLFLYEKSSDYNEKLSIAIELERAGVFTLPSADLMESIGKRLTKLETITSVSFKEIERSFVLEIFARHWSQNTYVFSYQENQYVSGRAVDNVYIVFDKNNDVKNYYLLLKNPTKFSPKKYLGVVATALSKELNRSDIKRRDIKIEKID